jgi:FtsH-binding integral membrane protein
MNDKELKDFLRQSLMKPSEPVRMNETIDLCTSIMRTRRRTAERRTDFWGYLSDIFRFEGMSILGLQIITLLITCFGISTITEAPKNIPIFMPLFVLAVIPVLFRSQRYGMCEIESVTRASGAQIVLAKLTLAGAANLVCMTVLLCVEYYLFHSVAGIGRLILYSTVPFLVCVVLLLRCVRLCKRESVTISLIITLGSCVGWGLSASYLPWLYEASAVGIWIVAVIVFAGFFANEIYYIAKMRKEGKMYGIIA